MGTLRGVNLGGWLVLERWITPSVFTGTNVHDEFTLCQKLGNSASLHLDNHRRNFINAADFDWIVSHGFDAIRLPIGHWVLGGFEPFVASAKYVDFALHQAKRCDLKVLLDLHTAPGSQNGKIHSGRGGAIEWHKNIHNIDQTLTVLEKIVKKWGKHPSLWGLQILNEPASQIDRKLLQEFYMRAYELVYKTNPKLRVVFSDAHKPDAWKKTNLVKLPGVMQDSHYYQLFNWRHRKLPTLLRLALIKKWSSQIKKISNKTDIMVGEWSARLDDKYRGIDEDFTKHYTALQLEAFSNAQAWFYWTYKTEGQDLWNLRYSIDNKKLEL